MSYVPGISVYSCRRFKRDKQERLMPGKEMEDVTLLLKEFLSKDEEDILLRRNYPNYIHGPEFPSTKTKLRKWMNEYKKHKKDDEEKAIDAISPYFVAIFPFHKDYKGVQFLLSNMTEYLNQFISENNLRELEDDEEVEIILSLNKHFERDPENTTDDEKWEKFRELIRKMYRNGTNSGS